MQYLKIGTKALFIIGILLVTGCKDRLIEKRTYMANVPIYMTYEQLNVSVASEQPRALVSPGKIYFKDNYLFVNEVSKGIHIFDNSIPAAPQKISFINIPGNVDLAIKGNILYADNYTDLVAIDLNNITNGIVTKRISGVFPYALPAHDPSYPLAKIDESLGVVIGWKIEETTDICKDADCGSSYPNWAWAESTGSMDNIFFAVYTPSALTPRSSGLGGSMARFAVYDDYLYAINSSDLKLFNIANPSDPESSSTIAIGWDIETIFPYNDKLFIGSQTGMFIYDLVNPSDPSFIAQFAHVRSCDPVVVEGDYAYVTLRSGNFCGGFNNQLDVIDISTLSSPQLIKSYPMTEPYGLGVDNGQLFICDGDDGLKVYSVADPYAIDQNLLSHQADINTFDVIPFNDVLMMIGDDGLYQYDYSDISNLVLLSVIPVN